jgi:hypothetical protein
MDLYFSYKNVAEIFRTQIFYIWMVLPNKDPRSKISNESW